MDFGGARPWVVGASVALAVAFVSSRLDGVAFAGSPAELLVRIAALPTLAVAAAMTVLASRLRRQCEVLASGEASGIDGAVEELRNGGRPIQGIFSGRIGADGEVTSPGGVVCAFYEATVREAGGRGGTGAILSRERAAGSLLRIRGERAHAAVAFSPAHAFAPEEARRCTVPGRLALATGEGAAEGDPPMEAVSHERVGRIGHSCFALGQLERGDAPGSYVIRGIGGGPAALFVAVSHAALRREWMLRSWATYAGAAALTAAAAWLLAR
jgi:hypothetical protein